MGVDLYALMMFNRHRAEDLVTWAGSVLGKFKCRERKKIKRATCVGGYASAAFSWETKAAPVFLSLSPL